MHENRTRPTGAKTCPECGADLANLDPRKHSITHYGPDPIPVNPRTLLARQRQAELLGEKVPEG